MIEQHASSYPTRRRVLRQAAGGCAALVLPAWDARAHQHHDHSAGAAQEGYVRRTGNYEFPDLSLRDSEGAAVPLRASLADKPVILNFIFTTCDAVCPVTSMTFSQLQDALGAERSAIHMVSISIDPEQDTPPVLKAYRARFGAGPQWKMLTGRLDDSILVQRAFDVYRGDKMNHRPATFLRTRAGQPWVRLEGFASAADVLREYRQLQPR
jgi:protein SCO1/2